MSNIEPAVNALVAEISKFLGPPTGTLRYIVFWSTNGFDVAIERETGPHVWLSDRWRPAHPAFANLPVERYTPGQPRISNLNAKNTPTLTKEHGARRISFVSDKVGAAAAAVRACAVDAGIVSEPEIVIQAKSVESPSTSPSR